MNMRQVTIQNNLDPVYTWFKSIYQFEMVIRGKLTVIEILFVYLFDREKVNQLKASKIPTNFFLT